MCQRVRLPAHVRELLGDSAESVHALLEMKMERSQGEREPLQNLYKRQHAHSLTERLRTCGDLRNELSACDNSKL